MHAANDTLLDDAPTSASAPTLPPHAFVSVVRYKSGAPVDELLYRIAMGDHGGALDAAQDLFDRRHIPVLVLPLSSLSDTMLGYSEELLLSFIDGNACLADVIEDSGLEMLDALRALCELLEKDIITLC